MGFFDSLVKAGKSAMQAANDATTNKMLEHWSRISNAPYDRVQDYYQQNNQPDTNNVLKRAFAIAALGDRTLFNKDADAKAKLLQLRERISLVDTQEARSLMEAIDRLK